MSEEASDRAGAEQQESPQDGEAAALIDEARDRVDANELSAARELLETLLSRYPESRVAAEGRELLEQIAAIDGLPVPPAPRGEGARNRDDAADPAAPGTTRQQTAPADTSGGDRIFFLAGDTSIDTRAERVLSRMVERLTRHRRLRVVVEGHADDGGNAGVETDLAQRRAEAARTWLTARGIDGARLRVQGFGRTKPIAICDRPQCAAQNRRVVLVLTDERWAALGAAGDRPDRGSATPQSSSGRRVPR